MLSSSKMVVNRYNFFYGTINPKERRHQKMFLISILIRRLPDIKMAGYLFIGYKALVVDWMPDVL